MDDGTACLMDDGTTSDGLNDLKIQQELKDL